VREGQTLLLGIPVFVSTTSDETGAIVRAVLLDDVRGRYDEEPVVNGFL